MKDTLNTLQYNKLKDLISKYIQTTYGHKALKKLKPIFNDFEKVKKEYATLNNFFEFFTKWGSLSLEDIFISQLIEDAFYDILSEKEIKKIGDFILQLSNIKEEIEKNDIDFYKELINFDIPQELGEKIYKSIDNYGLLKDTATDQLFKIREEKRKLQYKIERTLKSIMHGRVREILVDTTIFMKRSRYTLLLKPNYKEYINGRVIEIAKSGGFFVEPDSIFELNSSLEEIIAKEEAERRKILTELTRLIRENAQRLRKNEQKLGFLDLNIAKFFYSKNLPECYVEFKEKPIIFARRAKHPILAEIKSKVEPVDIDLKHSSTLIITGPNTGGKTVFLKTIGLLILSVYSAIPPFAENLEIGNIDNLFAIIGDNQDIFESLSGFSSKIASLKNAFSKATKRSIILVDEIGSGTSPEEGEAIAYAVIKEASKVCSVCASTHYRKLAYILKEEGFRVAAFEFDIKTLKPTYRLTYGKVGKSYGLEVMKTLNLSKNIVSLAEEFYRNHSSIFSQLESRMEKSIDKYIKRKEELERLKKEYADIVEKEKEEKEKIIKKLEKEKEEKIKELENLIEKLKKEISLFLKEKDISKAHRVLNEIKKKKNEFYEHKEEEKSNIELEIGDTVEFNNTKGTLISLKNNVATLEIEGKIITVNKKLLKRSTSSNDKNDNSIKIYVSRKTTPMELNLIGKRSDEAYIELIKFIDAMFMESAKRVRIIHGHGNGILKNMVRETLKNLANVKRFYPAPPQEGGDGATIVELV